MSALSDFKVEIDIYDMKDKVVELGTTKVNLDKQLTRTPQQNDKKTIKKQLKNNLHKSITSLMMYILHFRKNTTKLNLNL